MKSRANAHTITPESMYDQDASKEVSAKLKCAACNRTSIFRVPWVLISPPGERPPSDGDGILFGRIFRCKGCGAVDNYVVPAMTLVTLTAEAIGSAEGHGSGRVQMGVCVLWDGTACRRPTQGLDHLRKLAGKSPTSAAAWQRLGNLCNRYELYKEAVEAWQKATELDENDFESVWSLADYYRFSHAADAPDKATHYLVEALRRLPRCEVPDEERRTDFGFSLAEMLLEFSDMIDAPAVLMAAWGDGKPATRAPTIHVSSADLGAIDNEDGLAMFLSRDDLVALTLGHEPPKDSPTQLELLIAAGGIDDAGKRPRGVPPVVATRTPTPEPNQPCPCGSGKKYKRCCWLSKR